MTPHMSNFYSKLVLLIPLFIILPARADTEGDKLGFCTTSGNEENVDCKDRLPGSEYLQTSLFPFVPPSLKFFMKSKHGTDDPGNPTSSRVPKVIQKYLKWADLWRKSTVMRDILGSSGFTATENEYQWLGSWQRPKICKVSYQKVHSMPYYLELDDKAKMWRNVKRGIKILGNSSIDFLPETFVLPSDIEDFKIAYNKSGNHLWLVKIPNSTHGRGMYIIRNGRDEIPNTQKTVVVQKYVQNLYLINGGKVNIRFYVLTTSYDPLRVYMANEYLVQTARSNYTIETGDPCVLILRHADFHPQKCSHIINSNPTGSTNVSTKSQLFKQMTADGLDTEQFEGKLHDGIIKILLTTLGPPGNTRPPNYTRYNGYKLWGADVLIDDQGNPNILEFNAYPSTLIFQTNGNDTIERTKKTVITDALSVVGFNLPPFMSTKNKEFVMRSLNATNTLETPAFDERLYQTGLSKEAKLKQEKYRSGSLHGSSSVSSSYLYRDSILDDLTPDDVRQLLLAEDELSRSILTKGFKRLYPGIGMEKYMPLSKFDPYYDMLFDAWEWKYHLNRTAGIRRLQLLGQQKYHLRK